MIAAEIIGQVLDAGGQITADGADLVLTAPGPLPADLLDKLRAHKPALLAALAPIAKPRAPVNLDEALAAACRDLADITPTAFRALLAPEDVADIGAGAYPVSTLHAYAESFAEGLRSGRIVPGGEDVHE